MHYNELTSTNMPKIYCKVMAITEDLLAYFGIYKTWLVLQTKYYKNIQTLIYKSDFIIWQHNLETHDGITIRPLLYQLKELAQRKSMWKETDP